MKKHWNRFWWKLKEKLTDSAFVRHLSFLWHWKNFFFLLKYPFYRNYNRWTSKFMGYKYTELDSVPNGWRVAFGKQMSEDIKKAGKASRKRLKKHLSWKNMITWGQIKEKYGELRLYASATSEIQDVLDRYEILSQGYCINCGKPARYMTRGWIEFYCEECFVKDITRFSQKTEEDIAKEKKSCRLKKRDIPTLSIYDEGSKKSIKVDLKKEYGIDFEELWNLNNK